MAHSADAQQITTSALPTTPSSSRAPDTPKQQRLFDPIVPIAIDFVSEQDPSRASLHDRFCWNMSEKTVSVEAFARITCAENPHLLPFEGNIAKTIRAQVAEYASYYNHYHSLLEGGVLHAPDILTLLKINCSKNIVDEVLWDLANPYGTPEEVAKALVKEHNLPSEYIVTVSYTIREQIKQAIKEIVTRNIAPLKKSNVPNAPQRTFQMNAKPQQGTAVPVQMPTYAVQNTFPSTAPITPNMVTPVPSALPPTAHSNTGVPSVLQTPLPVNVNLNAQTRVAQTRVPTLIQAMPTQIHAAPMSVSMTMPVVQPGNQQLQKRTM